MDRTAVPFLPARPLLKSLREPWRGMSHRLVPALPALRQGDGQPVLVFPMFGAGPESTARLRHALERCGFGCHDWGQGVDLGPPSVSLRRRLRRLEERLIDIFEQDRRPVTLLGWGFSGLYARELAKRAAPLVRQVITLGTPFNMGAGDCAMLQRLRDETGQLPAALRAQLTERPPVPFTSIYTMSDSEAPWQLCVQGESPTSEDILVCAASHRALADDPQVRAIVTDRLARADDDWRPYAG